MERGRENFQSGIHGRKKDMDAFSDFSSSRSLLTGYELPKRRQKRSLHPSRLPLIQATVYIYIRFIYAWAPKNILQQQQ